MRRTEALALTPGTKLRMSNSAGPCLPVTLVKVNRTRASVLFYSSRLDEPLWSLHAEPCTCCMDHPQTQYPNGYDN